MDFNSYEKQLDVERMLRRPDTILLHKPTAEYAEYVDRCSPPTLNGMRRLIVSVEPRFDAPPDTATRCKHLLFRSVEQMKQVYLENEMIPLPIIIIRFADDSDEIEKLLQHIHHVRMTTLKCQHDDMMKNYAGDVVKNDVHKGAFPLRILFPTCRFTSVIQFMSRDMAWGFAKLGHQCAVTVETDDWLRKSMVSVNNAMVGFKPHIVFLVDSVRAHMFQAELKKSFFCVSWQQDDLPGLYDQHAINSQWSMDFNFSMFPELATKMRGLGYPNVQMLPIGVNTDIYKPSRQWSWERPYDIVFPCNIGSQRTVSEAKFLSRRLDPVLWALKMGLRVRLCGSGWEQLRSVLVPSDKLTIEDRIPNGPELARVYQSAHFVLHANSDTNMHQRVFEAGACHVPVLVYAHESDTKPDNLASILPINDALICFNDEDDFVRKVRYFLCDTQARAASSSVLYTEVTSKHTYIQRAMTILSALDYCKDIEGARPPEHVNV